METYPASNLTHGGILSARIIKIHGILKLDSGINSTKISKLYEENRQHDNLPNNLSAEGQKTIAKYFVSLVAKEKLI